MKLTIVIPALNEEQAIASIIERCLAAKAWIVEQSPVDDVEVIVVSDGSTDQTAPIARSFENAKLIEFKKNRGYGAAIKEGFAQGSGDLVSFLDADGTCDPRFFANLCSAIVDENASIALGSRLGPQSHMPGIRRLGNRIYALILSTLSNRPVSDTASGMRVIRRSVLDQLYPLPDGLNFTPAMSARALMDENLSIVELPMAYEERIGDSKLSVVKDGMRFLRTIFEMTLMWQPARLFRVSSALCFMLMVLLAMHPIESWIRTGSLQEDTISRLLTCLFLGALGSTLISAGVLSSRLHELVSDKPRKQSSIARAVDAIFSARGWALQCAFAIPALVWLVGPGIYTRVMEGQVYIHWSRVVLAGLISFTLVQSLVTMLVGNVISFHNQRRRSALADRKTKEASIQGADLNILIPPPSQPVLRKETASTP